MVTATKSGQDAGVQERCVNADNGEVVKHATGSLGPFADSAAATDGVANWVVAGRKGDSHQIWASLMATDASVE